MLCKVHKVDKGERFNDVMYNKWVWLGSQKVLRFKCFLVFIWDAPCMNWTFASRVGDLRSYPIIYSTYNKIKLSSKLVGNYAIIQPTCHHMTSSACQIDRLWEEHTWMFTGDLQVQSMMTEKPFFSKTT